MAHASWRRWIHASVASFLKEVATDNSLAVLIEGIDDRDQAFMESQDRVEVRLNGPFSQELSHGYHRIHVDINVLVTSHMGGTQKNAYQLDTLLGIFHNAMDGVISVFRLGTGLDDEDDESLVMCLSPRPGNGDSIRVIDFGQIDKVDRIRQGVVDGRYVAYVSE